MIRRLPVKLTEPELLAKSDELAHAVDEMASLEGEKKSKAKYFGDLIKEARETIDDLAMDIRNKTEIRDVSCSEVPNYKEGTMAIVRDDTDTVVETRTMSEEERQHKLELLDKRRVGEE